MTYRSPAFVARRYDRLAPIYGALSAAFFLRPRVRREAVAQLRLAAGASVLEVGCGSGVNLALLREAVGPTGRALGTDISPGMLRRAEEEKRRRGWSNVTLLSQEATELDVAGPFDAILFSLSYSVLPDRPRALAAAWRLLLPAGRLVIMDAGLPDGRLGRLLQPATRALSRATVLGDPATRPWEDLAALADQVDFERLWPGTYFVCSASKPG